MRPTFLFSTSVMLLAWAVAPSPAGAQDWFRQRTVDGVSYPVTRPAERMRQQNALQRGKASDRATPRRVATVYPATGLPLAIPDNYPPGISSTITVPTTAPTGAVTLSLYIQHTWRGDLVVSLTAPNGSQFMLSNRQGGSADDIVLTDWPVGLPPGAPVQGPWTLSIADLAAADVGQLVSWSLTIAGGSSAGTSVDLSMSIEANPTGDNDGNTQGNPGSEEQDKWERIIQHFADGVYEMTNGAHRIGTVRVFRSGRNSGSADVRWGHRGHPHVPFLGGVALGGHVMMYEIFENGEGGVSDKDMLADEQGSGYTLADEWGHYYLGLYDEYADSCGIFNGLCVSVEPSIMNSQWYATGSPPDYRWLNFSIRNQGGGDFQDTLANWQHFAYGASAWEVLARPLAEDPLNPLRISLGPRIYYPELTPVAPADGTVPAIDLSGGNDVARSALNILWMSEVHDAEIVIDHSGSMSGDKLNQAKTAAKLLVDRAELGTTRLGVTAFDDVVTNVVPQTLISTAADRAAIKTAIDGITAGNMTAIGEAAAAALAKLTALNAPGENKAVFLLSDGMSNTGRDPLSVIPAYTAASVPLFTFGFGADADGVVLGQLATGTGGRYFFSPTLLAQITAAFQAANLLATSSPGLKSGSLSPSPAAPAVATVPVDPSLVRLQSTVVYTGAPPTSVVSLVSPSGQAVPATSTATGGAGEQLVYFDVVQPAPGNWQVLVAAAGAGPSYEFTVTGTHGGVGYTLNTTVDQDGVTAAVVIEGHLSRRQPIAGATVFATVTSPAGVSSTLQLLDNGVAPDVTANDGTYTASYAPSMQGTYQAYVEASNPGGTAAETYGATLPSPTTTGTRPPLPPDVPIAEAFVRSQSIQFSSTAVALADRYRLYSDITKEHHYTTDTNEYAVLGTRGWVQEGIAHRVYMSDAPVAGQVPAPLYRLYHPGIRQHLWTTDANEYAVLGGLNWTQEGVDGYILMHEVPGSTVPLYRLMYVFLPLHLWTTDLNEYTVLPSQGWVQEGIVGHVVP